MNGRWDIRKIGNLLGFGNDEKMIEKLKTTVSFSNHMSAVVNSRSYHLTIGNFLKRAMEKDYNLLRARTRDEKLSLERLSGRLEAWEEIEDFINSTIKNGQYSMTKLQEVEANVRKRAS